jgi:hypothetical protein
MAALEDIKEKEISGEFGKGMKLAESFSADDQTRHYKNLGIGAALVAGLAYWIKR